LANQYFARKSIDKLIADSERPEHQLKKSLGPWSLTALGIGAVIGSGIFTVIGTAIAGQTFSVSSILNAPVLEYLIHHSATFGRPGAGPAIALSFILVAVACAFTALCYAELASMIPIAGSAYTYTYATMGEIVAWIIGWDLILEYAVSNMAVSVGFAAHAVDLLDWFGLHPSLRWVSPAYLPEGLQDLAGKDLYGPGWHFGFNFPAFLVVMILTVILVRGIRESAETNNFMVLIKIAAILIFVFTGLQFIHPGNWHPFMPNGWAGLLTGGSIIFFTYIGFDSVSTAAEEARNPQRDLPIGIIATLLICTVLYVAVVVVLTGIAHWDTLGDAAPVVNVLRKLNVPWVRLAVLIGAMMGMISSLLVFQLGQARVWFAMSRDRLLPRAFGKVHRRYRTPDVATWVAGFVVGIPAGLLDIGTLADLSNIGTLFAFALVAGGVLILRYREPRRARGFRAPGGNLAPVMTILTCLLLMAGLPIMNWIRFFGWLLIGLMIFFSWGRYWSEFADPAFRRLLDEESEVRAAMNPAQKQLYDSRRKRPGLAWLLNVFCGVFGGHLYYVNHAGRGILRTGVFLAAILLKMLYSSSHNQAALYLLLLCSSVLVLFSLIELMTIVRKTQEFNVTTARTVVASLKASV
jgi:APA family basic amino acid/polyamine antiporter